MAELARLDLARHGRWLGRLGGEAHAYAIAGADGALLWTSEGSGERFAAWLARQSLLSVEAASDTRVMPVTGGGTGVIVAVAGAAPTPAGWLLALLTGNQESSRLAADRVVEACDDVAQALAEANAMHGELDTMARELAERYDELHLVYAVDRELRRGRDHDCIFDRLLEVCASHLNLDVVALLRAEPRRLHYATRLSEPIHNLDLVLTEMRGDLFRFVCSSKQPIVLNEITDSRRRYIFSDMPYRVLAAPVERDGRVIGLLVLLNRLAKPEFRNSDRKLAEMMASQFSSMFQNYDLLDQLGEFNDQMAAALIEAVEAKDPYTRGHSERVHFLAMELGRALDLPEDEMDDLHWAALLHDVGKIGIPDVVLCKPGRLTEDEYTFIKVHPERSYEILRHVERLKGAVDGARHHQEMWDGRGYPHGLKGNRIPLHARIIAVADTYDSITSSRAYRPGMSHEFAMREMARVSGTQLDPQLFELFRGLCAKEPEWLKRFGIRRDLPPVDPEPAAAVPGATSAAATADEVR